MPSPALHPPRTARTSRSRRRKSPTRAAAVAAVKGKYAAVPTSSTRFAAAKRHEVRRENSSR